MYALFKATIRYTYITYTWLSNLKITLQFFILEKESPWKIDSISYV